MTTPECPREGEVIAAVLAGRWAEGADALRAHAAHCEVCRDLGDVVSLLRDEHDALADVRVPAAGQVWWRAAIRARVEATHTASRPFTWMAGAGAAVALGLAAASAGLLWPLLLPLVEWVSPISWATAIDFGDGSSLSRLAWTGGLIALGAVTCIVLAPIALYYALADD